MRNRKATGVLAPALRHGTFGVEARCSFFGNVVAVAGNSRSDPKSLVQNPNSISSQ